MIIGVVGAGEEISARPFQLVKWGIHGKVQHLVVMRGRTDVPMIVDWYMDGKIDDINKGFAEMHNNIRTVVTF